MSDFHMTRSTGKRAYHIKNTLPSDPNMLPIKDWSKTNQECYLKFRVWLHTTGYSQSTIQTYLIGARFVLGFLKKPYLAIDPDQDIGHVLEYCQKNEPSSAKLDCYRKGFNAFRRYLCKAQNRPITPKKIHWQYYLTGLPENLSSAIVDFTQQCQRSWRMDLRHEATITHLSHLTHSLRWMAFHLNVSSISDIAPKVWYAYLDVRLSSGISPASLNVELKALRSFLFFAQDLGMPVCESFFKIPKLPVGSYSPKDIPLEELRSLMAEIRQKSCSTQNRDRQIGLMDWTWFLLMLYSGLRTSEVRKLCLEDIDFTSSRIHIMQSKGNKDRIVYFSQTVSDALQAYLEVRGWKREINKKVFLFRNEPLSKSYCGHRLRSYGNQCRVHITPHQLRHTCATLLLNEKVPVVSIQKILGHQRAETTMGYARLYDHTVAEDYFRAMERIEVISPSKT